MASSINRQVSQALLRRLKDKKTSNREAARLADLIAIFQGKHLPVQMIERPVETVPEPDAAPKNDLTHLLGDV